MCLSSPVHLDLEEFLLRGRFAHLRLGQTPEWMKVNFPPPGPSSADQAPDPALLWHYGNLELHFRDEHLVKISCDCPAEMDGGPQVTVDPWILGTAEGRHLGYMLDLLLERNVAYSVRPLEALGRVDLALEASGARLRYSSEGKTPPADRRSLVLCALWLEAPF